MATVLLASINVVPCGIDSDKQNEYDAPLISDC